MQTLVFSLQYHAHRWEFWRILKGTAEVELDHKTSLMAEGENVIIPCGCKHRVKAVNDACVILEISYGKFDENDIIRIEDDYCRITKI